MSEQRISVSLAFSADTTKVRAQLQELQTSLQNIVKSTSNIGTGNLTKGLNEGVKAAAELSAHLQKATNTSTGRLDFTTLNNSIKASGTSLQDYGNKLKSMGPQGEAAFKQLTQAVANSNVRIKGTHKTLDKLWDTMKKTMGWHISSSVINNLSKGLSSAYGYAKDLNRSLNDIRIVSGQSADQMAKFAEQANQSAKSLSTTTTAYTDAALIFYQQGLKGDAVTERTDAVMKMSNVTGESAADVSSYMTAVWNNFDDGSKSLEYYADVMTALGAATASSTDEIAQGLEKFASIGDTVGLSYEYATSALATVVAETRQSADTVGTAFKTIFARLQGLELGKTLEDGTDLNKYSEALAKVGVKIKDEAGNMKEMDTILEELGSKWGTLAKDQQMALAQTVAGTRQYTQLISLMDNWGTFQQNLTTAQTSEGSLQKQADIYAESWQAASKRVTAAAQGIFQDLLDDDFFIDLLNMAEGFLNLLNQIIDSMGGLPGLLSTIGALMTKIFGKQISQSLTKMGQELSLMTVRGREKQVKERDAVIQQGIDYYANEEIADSGAATASRSKSMAINLRLQQEMLNNVEKMSDIEKLTNQSLLERQGILADLAEKKGQEYDEVHKISDSMVNDVKVEAEEFIATGATEEDRESDSNKHKKSLKNLQETVKAEVKVENVSGTRNYQDELNKLQEQMKGLEGEELNKLQAQFDKVSAESEQFKQDIAEVVEQLNKVEDSNLEELTTNLENAAKNGQNCEKELKDVYEQLARIKKGSKDSLKDFTEDPKKIDETAEALKNTAKAKEESDKANKKVVDGAKQVEENLKGAQGTQKSWSDTLVKSADGIMSITSAFTSFSSIASTLSNPDISGWEKFSSVLMSLGMGIPMLITGFGQVTGVLSGLNVVQAASNAIIAQQIQARMIESGLAKQEIASMTAKQIAQALGITMDKAEELQTKAKTGATLEEAATEAGLIGIKGTGILASISSTLAKKAEEMAIRAKTAAEAGETAGIWANVAAWIAQQAAAFPVLIITLAIIAALAALALIIAGVVMVVNAMADAYNADAIAAENAETAAKNLAEAYQETKTAYDEMISSMEEYQNARDGLDSLTKGTEEYEDALKKANQAALELINTYPELFSPEDYEWKDGELIIDKQALKDAEQEKQEDVDQAYATSQMASANAKQMRANADATELKRQIRGESGFWDGDMTAKTIINSLAAIGGVALAVPTGGLSLGVTAGAAANQAWAAGERSTEFNNAIDKAIEAVTDNPNLFDSEEYLSKTLEIDDQDLIDALMQNKDSIEGLAADFNAAEQASKLAAQNTANELLKGKGFETTEAGQAALKASGSVYQKEYDEAFEKRLKEATSRDWWSFGAHGSADAKGAFETYAKESGLDQLKDFKAIDYRQDGKVEYSYIDEEGQEQKKLATAEEIAAVLATADAAEELENSMRELQATIGKLKGSDKVEDQALADFLANGDLTGTTKEELKALKGQFDEEKDYEVDEETGEKTLKEDSARAYLEQKLGKENVTDAQVQGFVASMEITYPEELPEAVGEDIGKQLTTGAANKINGVYKTLGEEGGKAFSGALNAAKDAVDWENMLPEEQEDMINQLTNIDWTSWDAGTQAAQIVRDFGGNIDVTSEKWTGFIDQIRDSSNAIPDIENLRKSYNRAIEVSKELETGSIVSPKDYNTLVNYNAELEKYFTILSDGTAKFTGDILDFQQKIENLRKKELSNSIKESFDYAAEASTEYSILADQFGEEKINELRQSSIIGTTSKGSYVSFGEQDRKISSDFGVDALQATYAELDRNQLNEQLSFLESTNYDSKAIEDWQTKYENVSLTEEDISNITKAVNEQANAWEQTGTKAKEALENSKQAMQELAFAAEDAEERKELLEKGPEEGGIDEEAYGLAAMSAMQEEKYEGLDDEEIEKVEDYSKHLQKAAKSSDLLSDSLKNNEEAAEDIALYTVKMTKGVDKLANGFEDWSDVLKKSDKSSQEYMEAMDGMKDAMSDVLGVSEDFLSDDFIVDNMEDIKLAAEGDAEAIDRLAIAAGKDILVNLDIQDESIREEIYALHDELAIQIPDLKMNIGTELTGTDEFVAKANEIVSKAGMTAEEANAYFRGMGFTPHFKMVDASQAQSVPLTTTYHERDILERDKETNEPIKWKDTEYSETRQVSGGELVSSLPSLIMEDANGNMPQFPSAKIESMTVTNAGSMNNYSSSNSGGKSPGSGSGSGSSSSKPQTTEKKKVDTTPNEKLIEKLSKSIDSLTRKYDKASEASDRFYGKKRVQSLKEEAKYANKLAKEYTNLKKAYSGDAKKMLTKEQGKDRKGKNKGLFDTEVQTNEDGYIINETALREEATKDYNNAAKVYDNAMNAAAKMSDKKAKEKAEEAAKKAFKKAEDKYDDQMDWIDKYTETVDNKFDAEEKAAEQRLIEWQKKLEAITYTVEVQVELNEEDIEDIERILENIQGQKATSRGYYAKQIGLYEDEAAEEFQKIKSNNQGISGIYQRAGLDKVRADQLASGQITREDLTAKEKNALNKHFSNNVEDKDALLEFLNGNEDSAQNIYDIYHDNIPEVLNTFFEDMSEGIDSATEDFDRLTDTVETLNSVIEITGRNILGIDSGLIINNANTQWEIARDKYKTSIVNANKAQNIYDKLIKQMENNPELKNDRDWQDTFNTAKENAEDGAAAVRENLVGAIEAAENAFTVTINETLTTLQAGLAGVYKSLEDMRDAYEKANTLEEMYLKDYAKTYNLTKLTRDISKSIENSSNIRGQQKLNELLEEANEYMRQGVEMSQADFDYLQKKYDLRLAEIALEEAQNAKKSVRLTQDSEGNWGYVYSADSTAIDSAQQAYDDKLYELQRFAEETEKTLTDQYLKAWEDCYAEMEELQVSDFESQEEYTKALMGIYNHYAQVAGNSLTELNGLYAENAEINAEYGTALNAAFGQGDLASIYGVSNISQLMSLTEGEVLEAISKMGSAFKERKDKIDSLLPDGKTWEEVYSETLTSASDELKTLNDQFKEGGSFWKTYEKYFSDLLDALGVSNKNYNKSVSGAVNNTKTANKAGENTVASASGLNQKDQTVNQAAKSANVGKNNLEVKFKEKSNLWVVGKNGKVKREIPKDMVNASYQYKKEKGKNIDGIPSKYDNITFYKFLRKNGDVFWAVKNWLDKDSKEKMSSFDTGGYTGEWGSSGKLAMLHQKEIVLNAHDTANLLETVGLVRELASKLDLTALAKQFNLNSSNTTGLQNQKEHIVQQDVHITAEFPGVTNRNEIEEAFNNLVNRVSQYTNKLY